MSLGYITEDTSQVHPCNVFYFFILLVGHHNFKKEPVAWTIYKCIGISNEKKKHHEDATGTYHQ